MAMIAIELLLDVFRQPADVVDEAMSTPYVTYLPRAHGSTTVRVYMEPTEVNANHCARLPGGQMSLDDAAK